MIYVVLLQLSCVKSIRCFHDVLVVLLSVRLAKAYVVSMQAKVRSSRDLVPSVVHLIAMAILAGYVWAVRLSGNV